MGRALVLSLLLPFRLAVQASDLTGVSVLCALLPYRNLVDVGRTASA